MKGSEKVSIVVPVYNAAAYLEKTVKMVQNQTFSGWELILVNDHSVDDSQKIMEKLAQQDARIRTFSQKKGVKGAANARNLGTEQMTGRYLAFLDADDVWMPDKLEKQLAFMKQEAAAFVFSAYEFGDENAEGTGKIVAVPDRLTYRKALSRTVIFTSTVLFDTEKIPQKLLYMPDVASEDTATWWQILREGYIARGFYESLAIYRRPRKSLSSNKLKAMARIWNLYRRQEKLSVIASAWYFCFWALRATLRRI